MRLLALLAAGVLAVSPVLAADHGDPVFGTGTPIPGTSRKIGQISEVRHDGELTVFEMSDDLGAHRLRR